MKRILKRRFTMISVICLSLLISIMGIFIYPIFRHTQHLLQYKKGIPESLYEEFPICFNENDLFQLSVIINNSHHLKLSLDTKAISLMKKDSIEKYNGTYWGSMPFASTNAYNEKSKIKFYSFNSITIGNQEIKMPLFESISKENLIYDIVADGVLGSDLLAIGCWKFNTEEQILKLFHPSNLELLEKETQGLIKIENGLRDNSIPLILREIGEEFNFTFDLGYSGSVEINNDIADILMCHYRFNQIRRIDKNGKIDTLNVFENIPISLAGIEVKNCQLVNIRSVNGNYIGAGLMKSFNFMLMYGDMVGHTRNQHLYLSNHNHNSFNFTKRYVSKFGFGIARQNGKIIIETIQTNSAAEKAGLIPGDEVIEIKGMEDLLLSEQIGNSLINYTEYSNFLEIKTKKNDRVQLIIP